MKDKVLHVSCGGLGYGGVSSVILSIVESLHNSFDFGCVVFNYHGEREAIFKNYGELYRINAYSVNGRRSISEMILRPFRLYFGIKKICKDNQFNVIHCHNNNEEGICLLAAKHARVPIRIAHSHITSSTRKRLFIFRIIDNINRKMTVHNATELIGCSEAACNSFFGKSNHKVIYNSVDFSKFKIDKKTSDNRNKKTFIHVGRYTYPKNQEFVIRVFKHLVDKCSDFKLFLVGYGEDEYALKALVKELNIEGKVDFINGKDVDIVKYYQVADYMIFPSRYEGFGIVLIEAQAMKIQCFVSEAIPKEADVGLITYLSLKKSSEDWACAIMNAIKSNMCIDEKMLISNLSKFSYTVIAGK